MFVLKLRPLPTRLRNHYRHYRQLGFGRLQALRSAWRVARSHPSIATKKRQEAARVLKRN